MKTTRKHLLALLLIPYSLSLYAQEELGFNDKTQAWISHCSAIPAIKASTAVNLFIDDEVNDGNWALYDRLWVFGLDAETSALQSIANPGSTTAVAVNSPTFTAYQGYNSNGSSSYINMEYNVITQGVNFTQNSNSFGCYILTDGEQGNYSDMGANTSGFFTGTMFFLINYSASLNVIMYHSVQGNAFNGYFQAGQNLTGMFVSDVTGSSTAEGYYNGTGYTFLSDGGQTALPNMNVYALAENNANSSASRFTNRLNSLQFYAGGGIDAAAQNISITRLSNLLVW